jgi:hypothetical protein
MQIFCLKVYVFNVTNKDDWLKGGGKVKLKVQEVGPLIYRQVLHILYYLSYSCSTIMLRAPNNYVMYVQILEWQN